MDTERDTAKGQARTQMEDISAMMDRIRHAKGCDGGMDCAVTDKTVAAAFLVRQGEWREFDEDSEDSNKEWREFYHDCEDAALRVREHPLSVQVRSDWEDEEDEMLPAEFRILLCINGPLYSRQPGTSGRLPAGSRAVCIIGEFARWTPGGRWCPPCSARLEYQDESTPWTQYLDADEADLLQYVGHFFSP
jgi:hypothetical protein